MHNTELEREGERERERVKWDDREEKRNEEGRPNIKQVICTWSCLGGLIIMWPCTIMYMYM